MFLVERSHYGCFESSGKEPSERDKFIRVVIGLIRASRQDFRRKVGIGSKLQVALEEERIALRTSASVAGEKVDKEVGV